MANMNMAMIVLSCDKYSTIWKDFFNLKDIYWKDCSYPWYLVTESADFLRSDVKVIKCGNELNWSERLRMALNQIDADYLGLFLDDYFISETVDNGSIDSLICLMEKENISTINVSNVFKWIINQPQKEYFKEHLIRVPNHLRWGISTESTIWNKKFLLSTLGEGDYSAWQFEIDRCKEAASELGLRGLNLCDDRMPFKVSRTPVVIQGAFYPKAIREFKRRGYIIDTSNFPIMSTKKVIIYDLKSAFAKLSFGRNIFKWIGSHVFGIKFFSDSL